MKSKFKIGDLVKVRDRARELDWNDKNFGLLLEASLDDEGNALIPPVYYMKSVGVVLSVELSVPITGHAGLDEDDGIHYGEISAETYQIVVAGAKHEIEAYLLEKIEI